VVSKTSTAAPICGTPEESFTHPEIDPGVTAALAVRHRARTELRTQPVVRVIPITPPQSIFRDKNVADETAAAGPSKLLDSKAYRGRYLLLGNIIVYFHRQPVLSRLKATQRQPFLQRYLLPDILHVVG